MTGTDVITARVVEARRHVERYTPEQAAAAMERGALVVDLRPLEYRLRNGEIPGAIAVSRHVLEWRLDVSSEHRLKELDHGDTAREIILVCNEGYTSSLAARQVMRELGLTNVKDVVGGFAAWREAGLGVLPRTGLAS